MRYEELKPSKVFHWFKEIEKIPRGSGNEKQISDFLVNFAKERNLEVYQDESLNVIIKKQASKGYENSAAVIIQGHMDMVCEKTADSSHDFTKDAIKLIVEGNKLRADNTTLGADDGIAIAYGLAILDSDDIKHPELELLITTQEETGLYGAMAVTGKHLSGKYLINIDTEEEGEFVVSCAGGVNVITTFEASRNEVNKNGFEIEIKGLLGGHSGIEIHKQRANANKLLGEIVYNLLKHTKVEISSIEGGSKHNAIANTAKVLFACDNLSEAKTFFGGNFIKELRAKAAITDPDITIDIKECKITKIYDEEFSQRLINFLYLLPYGVIEVITDLDNMVQTSTNIGVVSMKEDRIEFNSALRSSDDFSLESLKEHIILLSKLCCAKTEIKAAYPGWKYEETSFIRDMAVKAYKEIYKEDVKITAIHAGLECGLLKKVLTDTQMISYGPTIKNAHTPFEYIDIESVERVWKLTLRLLELMK